MFSNTVKRPVPAENQTTANMTSNTIERSDDDDDDDDMGK
jgi:hypothetical protein